MKQALLTLETETTEPNFWRGLVFLFPVLVVEVKKRLRVMVEEKPKSYIRIENEKMEYCPVCGSKRITGPHHKRETNVTPIVLAYTCGKCQYVQYVHTENSKFLKGMNIEPL